MIEWVFGVEHGQQMRTAPDLKVWSDVEIRGEEGPAEVVLEAKYNEDLGRYLLTKFSLEIREPGIEITGTTLRNVPVHTMLRDALGRLVQVELDTGESFDVEQVVDAREEIVGGGPRSDEAMLATARVYRWAQIVGLPAAKMVQRTLGLTTPTATLWIRRARDLGLLGDYHGNSDG